MWLNQCVLLVGEIVAGNHYLRCQQYFRAVYHYRAADVGSRIVHGAPTTVSTKTIHDFLSDKAVDLAALTIFLDGLDADQRIHHVRSLTPTEQALLFEAAANFRALRLTDLVPEATPLLQEVIHHGRNSLPILRFFEKRFCLPRMHMEIESQGAGAICRL
jgi:hypothetical protein